ncbi:hypothetical protein KSX_67250 [Ktedonospora formicarum]|uniref:Uncharacterized protein n=1 Tax=Ktedonospora formicarum TaxID=2778364 RepID=A0A8J3I9P8_9CHLR|nr:hypothetical protein KSX_67250 [Ktedonospora formicarum]
MCYEQQILTQWPTHLLSYDFPELRDGLLGLSHPLQQCMLLWNDISYHWLPTLQPAESITPAIYVIEHIFHFHCKLSQIFKQARKRDR